MWYSRTNQREAELLFELLNLTTERRLRHVEPFGRAAEVQLFSHGHEVAEVPELHTMPLEYRTQGNRSWTAEVAVDENRDMAKSLMKVWHIRRFGLDALEQIEQPRPEPGPHELLVRVRAVSLNYRDQLVIDGTFVPDLALPFVPASDAAGEVVAIGNDVTRFRVGDRVMGI